MKRHRLGMKNKILLVCAGSMMLTLLGIMLVFQNTSTKTIYQQTKDAMYHSMENMQDDMDEIFARIEYGLIGVYEQGTLCNDLKRGKSVEYMRSQYYFAAQEMATDQFKSDDALVALYIYDRNQNLISNYRHAVTPAYDYPEDLFAGEECNIESLKKYIQDQTVDMLISSYYNQSRSRQMVRFALNIFSGSNRIGCIVCDVDSKIFVEVMKRYAAEENNIIWMQPVGDIPAAMYGDVEERYYTGYEEIVNEVLRANNVQQLQLQVQEGVLFRFPENHYNLELYSFVPSSLMVHNQKSLMQNLFVVAFISMLFSICFSMVMSEYLVWPLEKLTETMRRIREGETNLRVEKLGTDEVEEMGNTFNKMLDEMEGLITKDYQTRLMLNQMEYKALQSQINPHFLYNTLDTMSSIAEIQNCPMVSNLSQALSHIFRYSLDIKHPMSTVEKELLHLKSYIYVMNVRMSNQVQYKLKAEPDTLRLLLPRLTIQPLVENAIKHGIRHAKGKKIICVEIEIDGRNLKICVQDTGEGFQADKLNEELRVNELDYVEQGSSIGLHNINARIRLLYGDGYGVAVKSAPGQGTCVIVTMPQIGDGETNEWGKV